MSAPSKRIAEWLLILFYLFVFATTLVEQVEFLNENAIAIPIALAGIYITISVGFRYSLFYALLVFPLGFDWLYFQVMAPHLPAFFIRFHQNRWIFGGLYLLFLGFLFWKNWLYVGLICFLFGGFRVEKNLFVQVYHAFQFSHEGLISPSILQRNLARIDSNDQSPIYLICLDGYPKLAGSPYAKFGRLDSILRQEKFHPQDYVAHSFQTPVAVRYLLTGRFQKQEFTNLNAAALGLELTSSLRGITPKNQIYLGSILGSYNLSKPFFSAIESIRPNRMFVKPFHTVVGDENRIGSSKFFEKYHAGLLAQIDGKTRQTKFLHFLTFHGLSAEKRVLVKEISWADQLLIQIIHRLKTQAPLAKVIIFSDHGERETRGMDPRRAIFYVNF